MERGRRIQNPSLLTRSITLYDEGPDAQSADDSLTVEGTGTFVADADSHIVHPTTIRHTQLRDLVSCLDEDTVLFVFQNYIKKFSFEADRVVTFHQLDYKPTVLAAGCGYVVTGSQLSDLTVTTSRGSLLHTVNLAASIINGLCIARHGPDDVRLATASNDLTIKVFSLPTMDVVATLRLPVPPNCSAVAPNGEWLATGGDSEMVTLFNVRGRDYERAATFNEFGGHCFTMAWSPDSNMFAAGSQDGQVCVWDVRSSKVLARLRSRQYPLIRGGVRCMKFAPAPLDLLTFSSHLNYTHVYDTRTFDPATRQCLRADPHNELNLSGLAFSPSGRRLFVGEEDRIRVYDVDTRRRRCFSTSKVM